jgi:hypothetical protein
MHTLHRNIIYHGGKAALQSKQPVAEDCCPQAMFTYGQLFTCRGSRSIRAFRRACEQPLNRSVINLRFLQLIGTFEFLKFVWYCFNISKIAK